MTTPQLLQQAKQGDPAAIAQLMNDSLNPKGIDAAVSRQGDRLQVMLTSPNVVNQTVLTQFVQNGIQNLNIPNIKTVEVVGQTQSDPAQNWSHIFTLNSASSTASSSPIQPPPPPSATVPPSLGTSMPSPSTVIQPTTGKGSPELSPTSATVDESLVDDLSLDDELSMDTIDQIVADAVEEVRTKIQSQLPFDPEASSVDPMDDLPAMASEMDGSFESDDTGVLGAETGVNALDSALEQAIQTGQLDDLLGADLDLMDLMSEDRSVAANPPPLPDSEWLDSSSDPSNLAETQGGADQPLLAVASAAPLAAATSFGLQPLASGDLESGDLESGDLDLDDLDSDERNYAEGLEAFDDLDSVDGDGRESDRDDAKIEAASQNAALGDKSASPILLALVSALTVGSVVGLVGYSIRSYEGNWYQVVVGEATATSENGDASEPETPDGTDEDSDPADGNTAAETNPDGGEADETTSDETTADGEAIAPDSPDSPDNADETISAPADEEFPTNPPNEAGTATDTEAEPESTAPTGDNAGDVTGAEDADTATLQPPDAAIANCPAIVSSPGQSLTLSQLQLDPEIAPADGIYTIVGCLTNHTDGTIVAATLDYEGRLSATASAKGSMYFDAPAPRATVPFRTRLTLPDDVSAIQVKGVIWNSEGESAQTLPLEFSLPLAIN